MARKRMIDPGIWQSEDFGRLSTLAKVVFIGMFSNADDYGRGRAKAAYIKSILFPYDEGMRIIDVDKTLSEIASNMSVTFYLHDGNEYYSLDSWHTFQKVEKPTQSVLPGPNDDGSEAIRGTFPESSPKPPRAVPPNRIEENRTEEKSAFALALRDFCEFRNKGKHRMTDRAKALLLTKLEKLAPNDEQLKTKILEQSIFRGWEGVFPLKDDDAGKPETASTLERRIYYRAGVGDVYEDGTPVATGG